MNKQISIRLDVLTPDEVEALVRFLFSVDRDACTNKDAMKVIRYYRDLTSQEDADNLMDSIE